MLNRNIEKPLQEQLADIFEEKIISCEYSEGEKLPSLRSLARDYDVSHETVNAAMGILKTRRLVKIVPQRGIYVSAGNSNPGRDTGFIGLIIDLGSRKPKPTVVAPLFGEFLALVSQELNKYNYHLVGNYICIEDEQDREVLSNLKENKIDGLIIANLFYPKLYDYIRENFNPVVSLLPVEPSDDFDQVSINIHSTYNKTAVEILERGAGSVRILNGPRNYYNFLEIVRGVTDACRKYGVEGPDESDYIIAAPGWRHQDAESAFSEWLDNGGRADLIMCSNDNMALGALNAAQKRGFKVPGDIQIVGGRNTPLCSMVRPQLSSVDWHYEELVGMAVEQLMKRINGDESAPLNQRICGHLEDRETLK